ncbi:globin family protein [Granulosicoccus antarcticus]|uniref:Flavohemoprotein n=1 Tax=Granulosicoccus antarcticus IMCC3135 TaxID=1192854 RepID=A0A2Z2NNS1_9GAMM|nr:globin family protein [Granulosicoccus antarcticus]ASJ71581.1 Flavohemoprotein [Granulosicoccus antarcticus IMCC3135]
MLPHQHHLVRESWKKLSPIRDTAAELFYQRLFSVYPELAPMFKGDMKVQGEKLMQMLDKAVDSLENMESSIEPLKQAGRAHRSYGVNEEDYEKFANCLFWTMKEGLGKAFDAPTREAWANTYATLSSIMIEGANYNKLPDSASIGKLPWLKRILGKAHAVLPVSLR